MRDEDYEILEGDMQGVADQLRDYVRDTRQLVRNFSRLANAVADTVRLLGKDRVAAAMVACLHALEDVTASGYENDYDNADWCDRFLGESDDD